MLGNTVAILKAENPVVIDNARFSFITDNLVRIEYAVDQAFLDDSTLFAIDRRCGDVDVRITRDGDNYTMRTTVFELVYSADGCGLGQNNLVARWIQDGETRSWRIPDRNHRNLGGPIVTLDEANSRIPMSQGLLSRDGWQVINDTGKDIFKNGTLQLRDRRHVQDIYLFVYGNDYRAAMKSLTAVSGKVPMTRKYVHGSWYCRWWPYTADDYREIVQGYKDHDFSLDILVFDMDWHRKDATIGAGHAGTKGWTGYSWNRKLIPDPEGLIAELAADNIHVTVNDHPHDGMRPHEDHYADFMKYMGLDPEKDAMPYFDAGDPRYMAAFFKAAHRPSEDMGVAFWWLDWQQDYAFPLVRGTTTNHLPWLNELYYEDSRSGGKRGTGFSRWGGWGDHRHPIQFSGDVYATWEMLDYEVEMTTKSGNAGCFFWAHDIGGFYRKGTPELYTRWTQYGLLNSSLRIHSVVGKDMDRRPWLWGERAEVAMRRIYHMRSRLMPYIYSSVRQCHTDAMPLLRGLYLDRPDDDRSYEHDTQFLFGDLILGAPVTEPGEGDDCVVNKTVYFPEGDEWYDIFDHKRYAGGTTESIPTPLDKTPVFVKGGYPLPMQPYTQRMASAVLDTLVVRCYPGRGGAYSLYEDDGISEAYLDGKYATTELSYSNADGLTTIKVAPAVGTYDGQPAKRSYRFELPGVDTTRKIRLNGKKVRATYSDDLGGMVVEVPGTDIRKILTLTVK